MGSDLHRNRDHDLWVLCTVVFVLLVAVAFCGFVLSGAQAAGG